MLRYLKAINRSHFEDVSRMITRDTPVQVVAALIVCTLTFWAGHTAIAVLIGIWMVCVEWVTFRLVKRLAPFASFERDQILLLTLILGCANAIIYLIPSLYLAGNPSVAMKLMAIIWVLGVQIHITNTWSRVPTFLLARLVPTFFMLVLTVFQASATTPAPSTQIEWTVALAFVFAFIYISIETIRHHIITERSLVEAEAEATARATQLEDAQRLDVLTGLLSRRAFDKALDVMLADSVAEEGHIAVFVIDLENFRPINHTYSHVAGDVVLETIAGRLKEMVSLTGIVGRMGGDEFICAICDVESHDAALQLAGDMRLVISRAIGWNDHHLKICASIGVSMTNSWAADNLPSVNKLCSTADQAMYAAKATGKREPVIYQPDVFEPRMSPQDRQTLIEAISTGDLRPHYQPKMNLQTGKIIGFEALTRWHHPDGSIREPDEFLSQIKDIGLQGDLIKTIAHQVIKDIRRLKKQDLNPGQVSINLPEFTLATVNGCRDLETIILDNRDIAEHLAFEITEDVFIARAADVIQSSLTKFRNLGVRISLDDFGTGYASFQHLRNLDFDELKIDTSFVKDLGQDAAAGVLVRGFLDIAKGLDIDVVAEGVETNDQKQALINMGCQMAQGYLFSPVVPFDQATALLLTQQKPKHVAI